ncbi:MAG: hypothetical protein NWE95_07385 [Candidatus Bathyarchaeota archaeon]|nr:hypothetical protein [Candidatus Bathyarchaeota archaeon]
MVSVARVKRKLPSLLVDGVTTYKPHWTEYKRKEYRLKRLARRNPAKYHTLLNKLLSTLEDIERAL